MSWEGPAPGRPAARASAQARSARRGGMGPRGRRRGAAQPGGAAWRAPHPVARRWLGAPGSAPEEEEGAADGKRAAAAPTPEDYAAAERLRRSASGAAGLGAAGSEAASDAASEGGASGTSLSSAALWHSAVTKVRPAGAAEEGGFRLQRSPPVVRPLCAAPTPCRLWHRPAPGRRRRCRRATPGRPAASTSSPWSTASERGAPGGRGGGGGGGGAAAGLAQGQQLESSSRSRPPASGRARFNISCLSPLHPQAPPLQPRRGPLGGRRRAGGRGRGGGGGETPSRRAAGRRASLTSPPPPAAAAAGPLRDGALRGGRDAPVLPHEEALKLHRQRVPGLAEGAKFRGQAVGGGWGLGRACLAPVAVLAASRLRGTRAPPNPVPHPSRPPPPARRSYKKPDVGRCAAWGAARWGAMGGGASIIHASPPPPTVSPPSPVRHPRRPQGGVPQ
jgi:hypothetical protein